MHQLGENASTLCIFKNSLQSKGATCLYELSTTMKAHKFPLFCFRTLTHTEAVNRRQARLGLLVAIPLYTHAPQLYKLWHSALGVELWRQGTSSKAFAMLHYLGVTQGIDAARANVDRVSEGYDSQITLWKESMEVHQLTFSNICAGTNILRNLCKQTFK